MSWFSRISAAVAPAWTLKRAAARQRLERLRKLGERRGRVFDSVSGDRLRYDFLNTSASPDSAIRSSTAALRHHVRRMEYNSGYVSGPIKRIVEHVVGSGIQFQASVRETRAVVAGGARISHDQAEEFNHRIEKLHAIWEQQADIRLIHNFAEHQQLVEGALVRDGAVLVVGRESRRPGRMIPFCQELLEIDRLRTPAGELTNPRIIDGIEYDEEGVPVRAYVLKRHPGEMVVPYVKADDFEELSIWNENGTRKVLHLFNPFRPEQLQGFSALAAGLADLQDHGRYTEAEIMAMLEDACLTGFVKTEDAEGFQAGYTTGNVGDGGDGASSDETTQRIHEFAPNKWHYLDPGQDVEIHSPSRPNQAFAEISEQLLRGPASALNIPPEFLTQNWRGMNYSNARTVILQFMRSCAVRYAYLVNHFLRPTYECFVASCIANNIIRAPGFSTLRGDYLEAEWIAPGWPWVDPVKEAQSKEIGLRGGWETLTAIAKQKGTNIDRLLEARARELRRMAELEEEYNITFPAAMKGEGSSPVSDEEPDDEDLEETEGGDGRSLRLVRGEAHAE